MTFARRVYCPPPSPPVRPATRRAVYAVLGEPIAPVPKHTYVRSPALLAAVRTLPCQHTGMVGQTEPAHANWGWGKGRGVKCDDNRVAALCARVHRDLDQGAVWTERERKLVWWLAHIRTVHLLLERGLWPARVPVPDIEHCPFDLEPA